MPPFTYQVLRTKKLSANLSLSIHPEKGVVVKAPFWLPDIAIRKFVEAKTDWIQNHLQKIEQKKVKEKEYTHGEKHLYFGKEHDLVVSHSETPQRTKVVVVGESLQVSVFSGHSGEARTREIKEALLRLYLETGIEYITERVNYYSGLLGVEYSQIDIKKVSSIWGSCSSKNKLCFNRKLIMAPKEIVDYVIIHEVSHMVHRDHSSRFWAQVARLDKNFREHRHWLKQNHSLLSI